jgi:hypothetical protein
MTTSQKVQILRCASFFVTAAYETVRLIPQKSRALPLALFAKPFQISSFVTFCESIKL